MKYSGLATCIGSIMHTVNCVQCNSYVIKKGSVAEYGSKIVTVRSSPKMLYLTQCNYFLVMDDYLISQWHLLILIANQQIIASQQPFA